MSKGPGRIQRAIVQACELEPDNAFTIEDLCQRLYPGLNRVEKSHRVAVLRAVKSIAAGDDNYTLARAEKAGGPIILHLTYSVMSRAMANMKGDRIWGYQTPDGDRQHPPVDEAYFRRLLSPGGRYFIRWVQPGGIVWRKVQALIEERDGLTPDPERHAFEAWSAAGEMLIALNRGMRPRGDDGRFSSIRRNRQ